MVALILLLALQDAPPVGQLTLEGGARVTRVTTVRAHVRAISPGSGELQMALSVDPKTAPAWVPFADSAVVELPSGDGDKKVTLRLKDSKGAESAPVDAVIRLDTTPPVAKIVAPERVEGSIVRVVFEVPDAVALQFTENLSEWSAWEPYATPRKIPLSSGAGKKIVFVRFRDEAGNESLPGRIVVESQAAAATPDPAPLGGLMVDVRRTTTGVLRLHLLADGRALAESRIVLDGVELQPRSPWKPEASFEIPPADGPRRVLLEAWDASGTVHQGEAVFQDRDAPAPSAPPGAAADQVGWTAGLQAGVLSSGIKFDSGTPVGHRRIKKGPMAAVRLEGGYAFDGVPFVLGTLEFDEGQDTHAVSAGVDFGLDFSLGKAFDTDFRGKMSAGGFLSWLNVDPGSFGDFKMGIGARVAVGVEARLSDQLWADLTVDYRFAVWQFDEKVLNGDDRAKMLSPGFLAGLTWRF